jgi:tRNA A-37 threonylcarbamoyl transferase component Bud32
MNIRKFLDEGQSGSTGTVYLALDELGREVAVKFFNMPVGPIRDHVIKHAQSLAQIKHPNVVQIYGIVDATRPNVADAQSEPALVMEFAPGQKFADWLNKPGLSRAEAYDVISGLLQGLAAFHQAKLSHGDLHAGNVRVFNGVTKIIDPIARDPNYALNTAQTRERQAADLSFAKRLIMDALRSANAKTQAFGEFCVMRTEISTIPQLLRQVELALKNPLESSNGSTQPILSFYDFCRNAQRDENTVAWQEAKKIALRALQPNLNNWRQSKHNLPSKLDDRRIAFAEVLQGANDLISLLLACAESGRDEHQTDLMLLRRFTMLEWDRSGATSFVGIPDSLLFATHYFVGAAACVNGFLRSAMSIGDMLVQRSRREDRVRVWEDRKWTGWADVFDGDCAESFKFLCEAYALLPVLRQVFPDEFAFRVGLGAYNWLLCCLEFVHQEPSNLKLPDDSGIVRSLYRPNVPPNFFRLTTAEIGEAFDVLFEDRNAAVELTKIGKLGPENWRRFWSPWMHGMLGLWRGSEYRFHDAPGFIFNAFSP